MFSNKKITVIQKGLNPSSYYWLSHLRPNYINFENSLEIDLLYISDKIILVRYIPLNYLIHLFRLNKKNKKIILFLDDDLLSLNIFSQLPIFYKLNLFLRIYCYKYFLKFFIEEIWTTNLSLKKKLTTQLNKKIKIKVLDLNFKNNLKFKKIYRISFIGTGSHILELKWIKKIFLTIQSQRDDCLIELFISKKWRSYFKSIPRIKMIYPMDWESFLLDTQNRNVDIVLNPILESEFNSFRSPTKFFDTTRLGAVGIYSKTKPYSSFVRNNYDGILLKNDISLWCQHINTLLKNQKKRKFLYSNAIKRME